jgi:hypothetical protein
MIVPGLLGLGNMVTAAVGVGFCIAGPARSRGLAIGATAVTSVHLILAFVIANNTDAGMFSPGIQIQAFGLYQKQERAFKRFEEMGKNPSESKLKELEAEGKELESFGKDNKDDIEAIQYYAGRRAIRESKEGRTVSSKELNREAPSAMRWADLGSQINFLDQIMEVLCYHNKIFTEYLLPLFTGLVEIAQIILCLLLIGSVARALKRDDAAGKAKIGLIAVCAAVGIAILLALISGLLQDNAEKEAKKAFENISTSGSTPQDFDSMQKKFKDAADKAKSAGKLSKNFSIVASLLTYFLYSGMMLMPALGALQASSAAAAKTRYRRP